MPSSFRSAFRLIAALEPGDRLTVLFTKCLICSLWLVLLLSDPINSPAAAQTGPSNPQAVTLISPDSDVTVIAKKPRIVCRIHIPAEPGSLYIQLDAFDVTQLAQIEADGFSFTPVQVLPAGEHRLTVSYTSEDGQSILEELEFRTQHSRAVEEIYSSNELSGIYENTFYRSDDVTGLPYWKTEANMYSQSHVASDDWSLSLQTNIRYFDQDKPEDSPLFTGAEVVDYLFTTTYSVNDLKLEMELGDVLIDESQNTVSSLSRRGGKLTAEYDPVWLSGFVVRSDKVYGLDSKWGVEPDKKDHLLGVSSGMSLFNNKAEISTVYVTGGEEPDDESYAIWPSPSGTRGRVLGVLCTTDFFSGKLKTELEADWSEYDPDTSDGVDYDSDKAFRADISGMASVFTYKAHYEYTGPEYQIPAQGAIQNDWEGFELTSGLSYEGHSLQASYSRFNDNVEDDATYARIYSDEYFLDYSCTVFPRVPLRLSYSKAIQDSEDEPFGFETKSTTDTYTGRIEYRPENWSIAFEPSHSELNDQTDLDFDSRLTTLAVRSRYSSEVLSVWPEVTFNRSTDLSTDVDTDSMTYSLGLSITAPFGFSLESTGSVIQIEADDSSVDQDLYNLDLQLAYGPEAPFWGIFAPWLALQGTYNRSEDHVLDSEIEEITVSVMLTGTLQLSF